MMMMTSSSSVSSETSDYQRSTPSPREDPFHIQTSSSSAASTSSSSSSSSSSGHGSDAESAASGSSSNVATIATAATTVDAAAAAANETPFKAESRRPSSHDDLGFCDDVKEDEDDDDVVVRNNSVSRSSGISTEAFYGTAPMSSSKTRLLLDLVKKHSKKKKKKKRSRKFPHLLLGKSSGLKINSDDPKLMFHQVKVELEKLPMLKEAEDRFARINVSPPKKKRAMDDDNDDDDGDNNSSSCWFAKRSKIDLAAQAVNNSSLFGNKDVKLIRPAVLTVKEEADDDGSSSSSKFSPKKTLNDGAAAAFLPLNTTKVIQNSSSSSSGYLFGGGDDFEQVPDDEIIIDDDDDDDLDDDEDEDDDDDVEVIGVLENKGRKKEGFEAEVDLAPPILSPVHIKQEDSSSSAAVQESSSSSSCPPPPPTSTPPPPTIPILMRFKKEEPKEQQQIRFPLQPGNRGCSMIECKWTDCQMSFTTHGKLSDHLRACHVIGQVLDQQAKLEADDDADELYRCLWDGCKVYGKSSCSKSWLEKHVPTHGGKFNFACMIGGCKQRFSSQKMLQRHVNNHFKKQEQQQQQSVKSSSKAGAGEAEGKAGADGGGRKGKKAKNPLIARKMVVENKSESTKNLKRAGVKLKYRPVVFSARIFDFFDASVMPGVREANYDLAKAKADVEEIEFTARVTAVRTNGKSGLREANVTWSPEDMLDDEWLPMSEVPRTKTVKIGLLPESAKVKLHHDLFKPHPTPTPPSSSPCGPPPPTGSAKRKMKMRPKQTF